MSASRQHIALHRRHYTGESVQQARRAIDNLEPGTAPIPKPLHQRSRTWRRAC